jgi:hypothetical protein
MRPLAIATVLLASMCLVTATTLAERSPTKSEARSIRAAALAYCHGLGTPSPCSYGSHTSLPQYRTRVSTVNARYAWADIFTDGLSGALIVRPHPHGAGWRVVVPGGGGLSPCSTWFHAAPHSVVRDLRLGGGVRGAYGEVEGTC